jgi:hypothetical protein
MTEDFFRCIIFIFCLFRSKILSVSFGRYRLLEHPLFNFRNHALFFDASKNSPTAGCVLAANLVFNDVDFFRNPITLLKQILNWNLLYWVLIITIIIIIIIINAHSK